MLLELNDRINYPNNQPNENEIFGKHSGNNFLIISLNSDGWDNTEFAGAIGDKITLEKAKNSN
jgi:hypothetical protein